MQYINKLLNFLKLTRNNLKNYSFNLKLIIKKN
jgi:hypothetical protein